MSLRSLWALPRTIRKFDTQAWDYERSTSASMAQCVALVFTIYALLFLPVSRMEFLPPEAVIFDLCGMALIVLVSLCYAYILKRRYSPEHLRWIAWWGFGYHSFLMGSIFFLWCMGGYVSITPMFIIVICFGFTWLHIRQYLTFISLTLTAILVAISLVEFDYFWFLEFMILYIFSVSLHLFHVSQQCKFFEYHSIIEADRNVDSLTGLLNRRALEESFTQRQQSQPKVAVIMVDLDHFKKVNDTFGHAAGDQALTYTAEIFKTVFRQDDLVARVGGDEFLIVLELGTNAEDVLSRKVDQLLKQVPLTFRSPGGTISVTFSIGGCLCEKVAGANLEQLIAKADAAMYQVKQNGRNAAIVTTEHTGQVRHPGNLAPVKIIDL